MTKVLAILLLLLNFSILQNTDGYVFGPIIDSILLFGEEYTTYMACQAASPSIRHDVLEHKKVPGVPYDSPIGPENIKFLLYTSLNSNWDDPQTLTLFSKKDEILSSNFNSSNPTLIYVHGLNSSYIGGAMGITAGLLPRKDMNVIIVDWDKYSMFLPQTYSINITIPRLGKLISIFVNQLIEAEADSKQIHLVGFSAGAQAVGLAGKLITPKVARISAQFSAWDPEGNCFNFLPSSKRIAKTDADFVLMVHCSLGTYATRLGILGHLTYYMNGGIIQPQCQEKRTLYDLAKCSHSQCEKYMFTWLLEDDTLIGQKCTSYLDFMFGDCECKNQLSLSFSTPTTIFGEYYVDTIANLSCAIV